MTTNKPEVVAWMTDDETMHFDTKAEAAAYCEEDEPVALIRLTDHERLQAETERLQAECAQLRAAIRRLCNIYVVGDYYMGQLREERLEAAVNQAIEQVKEINHDNQ